MDIEINQWKERALHFASLSIVMAIYPVREKDKLSCCWVDLFKP